MWLPRDERHILLGYYANTFDLGDRNVRRYLDKPKLFRSDDWTTVLEHPQWIPIVMPLFVQMHAKRIKAYGDGVTPPSGVDNMAVKGGVKATIQLQKRLEIANAHLKDRKLIEITPHESETGIAGVFLTLEGRDLGRKYNSWFDRSGLWFREYKDHWVLLIVGFLGGVLGALLVQSLSD